MKNYTKFLIPFFLLGFCFVSSCRKDLSPISNPDSVKHLKPDGKTSYSGDKLFDLLGCGYDVTGRFADPQSGRLQVIDIKKLYADDSLNIMKDLAGQTYFDAHGGENAENYSKNVTQEYTASLGVGIGKFKLFKGDINTTITQKDTFASKYSFANVSFLIKHKNFALTVTKSVLKSKYLTDKFRSDILLKTPKELVDDYGTHVLNHITLGAKLDLVYRSQTSSSDKSESVKAGATVNGLWNIFGFTADYQIDKTQANANFNQTLYYRTVGGDVTQGLIGQIDLDKPQSTIPIANWQSSCTFDRSALIGIDSKNGFIPLWELIDDPIKSAAVESYIREYLEHNQVAVEYEKIPIYDLYNQKQQDHMLDISLGVLEYGGWTYWGVLGYGFKEQAPGTIPIYDFFNESQKDHLASPDINETAGYPGWGFYGILFYAYKDAVPGSIPMYDFYNSKLKDHMKTPDRHAVDGVKNWEYRGISFYLAP